MTRRLLLSYLTVTLIVLLLLQVPLGVFYAQRERDRLSAAVERDARVIATIYEDGLESGTPLDPRPAAQYRARTNARVVIVDARGISLVDTDGTIDRDFSTRPEIRVALSGSRATGVRSSSTLGTNLLYVAVPVASSGVVHGALRVTLDASSIDARVHRFWLGLVAIAAVVLLAMALVGWAIARSVSRPIRLLNDAADRFSRGDLTVPDGSFGGPAELRTLAETMSTMAVRLDALIGEQRAFVADASHQLRTPLTALRLRLENLQTRVGEAESAELDTAIDETNRLAVLVADLLQLARADQHAPPVAVDLTALAGERVEIWTATAENRDVDLKFVAGASPAPALAVPGAVEQILDNVLDNAVNASPPGSTITVSLVPGPAHHQLHVCDQGPGMSDEDKARSTRRFWRGSTTSPGTGLGLAIASALALASSGRLELADAPDHGLSVTLTLPACPSNSAA